MPLKYVASLFNFVKRCVTGDTPGGGVDLSCVTGVHLTVVTLGLCHTNICHTHTFGGKNNGSHTNIWEKNESLRRVDRKLLMFLRWSLGGRKTVNGQ
jgi:hypothetical protein